ncbi:hypothetical protein, partial [Rhodopirellula bahusiensis]|uniref:hypothetical protein n=1 Tax=Rhodopirellula bahusiensis TaxID=2014065 RepID=UPI003297F286
MNTNPSPAEPHDEGPENQGPDSLRDEAMLDLLLQEALGGPTPPDQTGLILRRLADEDEGSPSKRAGSKNGSVSATSQSPTFTSKLSIVTLLIGTAAALLLSVGVAVGLKYRSDLALQAKADEAAKNTPSIPGPAPVAENQEGASTPTPEPAPRKRPRPIELAGDPSSSTGSDDSTTDPADSRDQPNVQPNRTPGSAPPITLVSQNVDKRWQSYWKRLGVSPTPSRDKESIQQELADRLGLVIPIDAIGDVEATRAAIQKPSNRQAISNRLLAAFLGKNPKQENAAESLSEVLKSGSGADRLISSWMRPSSGDATPQGDKQSESKKAAATPWIRMLQPADLHEVTVKTAALTNHQDLRCQRCHDVPNAGNEVPSQSDYWTAAAGLAPLLNPSRANKDIFYDTLDGRRQLASPPSDKQAKTWSNNLVGSRDLAEGIVSTLFALVHDSPSTTSPFDLSVASAASVPPETLRPLVDDLIASDFDVLRCLSILLSDAVMTRSVPDAMSPQGILVADDQQWSNAVSAVHAMAARSPFRRPGSAQRRLQVAQLDAKPNWPADSGRDALLAQPHGSELSADGTPSGAGDRRPDKD